MVLYLYLLTSCARFKLYQLVEKFVLNEVAAVYDDYVVTKLIAYSRNSTKKQDSSMTNNFPVEIRSELNEEFCSVIIGFLKEGLKFPIKMPPPLPNDVAPP